MHGAMRIGHVQMDRRVRIGLARLQKRMHETTVLAARIEQELLRARHRLRVHNDFAVVINLCGGRRAERRAREQGRSKNGRFHQGADSLSAPRQ